MRWAKYITYIHMRAGLPLRQSTPSLLQAMETWVSGSTYVYTTTNVVAKDMEVVGGFASPRKES